MTLPKRLQEIYNDWNDGSISTKDNGWLLELANKAVEMASNINRVNFDADGFCRSKEQASDFLEWVDGE